jgi:hypothetical protein
MWALSTVQPRGQRRDARQQPRRRHRLRRQDHGVTGAADRRVGVDIHRRRLEGTDGQTGRQQGRGDHGRGDDHAPDSPALQPDRLPRRRQRPELAEQVARIPFHERAQLGRARHPPGGGEGLRQLIGGEVIEPAAVHPLGVGTHRQHQHHVAQVHRLPPGRRADLGEGGVDQQQLSVADHEIARLDVPVREAGVPQLPDQQQPLVDKAVVDLGVAQLDGTEEELGYQQVLAFRRDLHDPVRRGAADPGVPQQPQHIVLVLGQLPHRTEWVLVFQGAVQDGAPQLVPPVRADMAQGVELAEQVLARVALHGQPQRRRPGR